jgi:glycosyltransferase involved in cell wall biosynthesis
MISTYSKPNLIAYILSPFANLQSADHFSSPTFLNLSTEALHLQKNGYQFEFFSPFEAGPCPWTQTDPTITALGQVRRIELGFTLWANLALLRLSGWHPFTEIYRLSRKMGWSSDFRSYMNFAAQVYLLKQRGVRHLHGCQGIESATTAMAMAHLLKIPFSFRVRAGDMAAAEVGLHQALTQAAFVTTPSKYDRQFIIRHIDPKYEDRVHVIYPMVDPEQIPLRSDLPAVQQLFILAIGDLVSGNGFIYLVEACRILHEQGIPFRCQIVGEGPEFGRLQAMIGAYGLPHLVQLAGSRSASETASLLDQATVLVFPQVMNHDATFGGIPQAVVEAMARGVPVVASESGSLPELIRDGAGLLVRPHHPGALAGALADLHLAGSAARQSMSRAVRQLVEVEFSATRLASLFEKSDDGRNPASLMPTFLKPREQFGVTFE